MIEQSLEIVLENGSRKSPENRAAQVCANLESFSWFDIRGTHGCLDIDATVLELMGVLILMLPSWNPWVSWYWSYSCGTHGCLDIDPSWISSEVISYTSWICRHWGRKMLYWCYIKTYFQLFAFSYMGWIMSLIKPGACDIWDGYQKKCPHSPPLMHTMMVMSIVFYPNDIYKITSCILELSNINV